MSRPATANLLAVAALALLLATVAEARVPMAVSGLGWLRDREMRLSLERLLNAREADSLDANAVEDGAVILNSSLADEGFQEPTIEIEARLDDGRVRRFPFDPLFATPIPRPLAARAVTFRVRTGVRWRVERVEIEGLKLFPRREGAAYFRTDATLLTVARTNAYSKSQVNRSEAALLDELRRRGHAESTVRAEIAGVNRRTGAVTLRVAVREGPRWVVDAIDLRAPAVEGVALPDTAPWMHGNWTPTLEQDMREVVRLAFYRGGYPDVGIRVETEPGKPVERRRPTAVTITVIPGSRIRMGRVRFEGNRVTRESVLRRRVRLKPGEPLDPVSLEHARFRISRLGVFERVDLHYDPADAAVRDPVFVVREGPRYETNLLAGYGSYEQFRGGVEYRQRNILGFAHQSRLLVIQSMKSSRGEYTYTVPELFGETIDGTAKLFGLQRQEIAFVRQEYGATLGLRRSVPSIHGEATVGYTFEALRNRENALSTEANANRQLNVASLNFGLSTDRRDSALRPRQGYHAAAQLEVASPNFGGVAQYQRFELTSAYHTSWGRGRWVHLGFSHGYISTMGAKNDRNLPVNKRFYPGGDNSIRGYRMGEAAPRGADGRFVGAKSYVIGNVELEQALTQSWSVVAFVDALGSARTLRRYPAEESLFSAGLGVRYQTIVGPVRLEYGRNLNPRPLDPGGTWQISLGYPF